MSICLSIYLSKSKPIRKWVTCYVKCLTISCCLRAQSSRQWKVIIFALLNASNLGLGPSWPPLQWVKGSPVPHAPLYRANGKTLLHARRASCKQTANAFCPCLELGVFVKSEGLPCQVPGTQLPAEQDYDVISVLLNASTFRIGSGWSPSAIVLNKHTPLLTINTSKKI